MKSPISRLGKYAHPPRVSKTSGTNTAKVTTQTKRGTGKTAALMTSHKTGGAIMAPQKSRGPLDNRGSKVARSIKASHRPRSY
jgi:hypothetical protein